MTPRERLFALEQFGVKLGLDNITRLLDALGRPDRAWRGIHVAGTNGKGSVTAMVERGLRAAGQRTGRYTSPHLSRIEERIAIDGSAVDAEAFDAVAAEVMALVDGLRRVGTLPAPPTFFEATTAMAFEIFRRRGVAAAVVEVGLGGRFDATNVITPDVAAVTSIAFDHERHLGSTLADIAFEKAGIIKPGIPVVVGELPAEARGVVEAVARQREAPVVDASLRHVESVEPAEGRPVVRIRTPRAAYGPLRLSLAGAHQVRNAVVAVRALETCAERGLAVRSEDVVTALTDVAWPARLEWLRMAACDVLLDAAHNPDGAAACAAYLRESGAAPLVIVMATMRDKQVSGIVEPLLTVASMVIATQADSPRSLGAGELAACVHRLNATTPVDTLSDPREAIDAAIARGQRVAVAGSIFLVGPIREYLIARGAQPAGGL
jgi:dihydrofolate synthase/folylpolyglutamate synthase